MDCSQPVAGPAFGAARWLAVIEHDPEKWASIFRKDSCSNKKMIDEHDSTRLKHSLEKQ
jgi:hypothetical protein